MKIKELVKDSDIDRKIEKVISYSANQEINLKNEISEYIATDSIEKNFQTLLENMQNSLNDSAQNEIGVWVSGFYGSGKSSFTKYFGFSFDEKCMVENIQFKDFFRDRLHTKISDLFLFFSIFFNINFIAFLKLLYFLAHLAEWIPGFPPNALIHSPESSEITGKLVNLEK